MLLAHLIGDGSFVTAPAGALREHVDEANLAAVTAAARAFGITAVRDDVSGGAVHHACGCLRRTALARGRRNPIAEWLDGLGLFGLRSHEKFVPASGVRRCRTSRSRCSSATCGRPTGRSAGTRARSIGRIYYASTSRRLVDDVARLLLRFGVLTRLKRDHASPAIATAGICTSRGRRTSVRSRVRSACTGRAATRHARLLKQLARHRSRTRTSTRCPREVWDKVRALLAERHMTHREFAAAMGSRFCGSTMWKHAPSRSRLARVAAVLHDAESGDARHQRRLLGRDRRGDEPRRAGRSSTLRFLARTTSWPTASPRTTRSSRTRTW